VMETLTKIRGIGHWTAENWLLFAVGRNDLLPAADIGIQNALKKFLDLSAKPPKDEIYKMGEEWSPYRSYATLTLWRSIEG
jgi:DNA-3-methyladenine glycosylase II